MQPRRARIPSSLHVLLSALLALSVALWGCGKAADGSPEGVADAFVEAYFRQMDQQRAKEFTALGATKMLDTELQEVAEVRKGGYDRGSVAVTVRRGDSSRREERIRIPYEIEIETEGTKQVRDADIELTKIDGAWKVVRIGVTSREPPDKKP